MNIFTIVTILWITLNMILRVLVCYNGEDRENEYQACQNIKNNQKLKQVVFFYGLFFIATITNYISLFLSIIIFVITANITNPTIKKYPKNQQKSMTTVFGTLFISQLLCSASIPITFFKINLIGVHNVFIYKTAIMFTSMFIGQTIGLFIILLTIHKRNPNGSTNTNSIQ